MTRGLLPRVRRSSMRLLGVSVAVVLGLQASIPAEASGPGVEPTPETPIALGKQFTDANETNHWGIGLFDGSTATLIAGGSEGSEYFSPAWSPDGAHLVFTDQDRLGVVTGEGRDLRFITNPVTCELDQVCQGDGDPDWSPDGMWIVFVRTTYNGSKFEPTQYRIMKVRPDGTDLTEVASVDESEGKYRYPRWSPDSQEILFYGETTTPITTRRSVYIVGADGSDLTDLTATHQNLNVQWSAGDWSPDGKRVSFTLLTDDLESEVWTIDIAGTDPRRLAELKSQGGFHFRSSKDGFLYFNDADLDSAALSRVPWSGGIPQAVSSRIDFGFDLHPGYRGRFADDDSSVFENAIEWLAAEGITEGCNPPANNRFCPNDPVTRGQMAAFLARAFGYSETGTGDYFKDTADSVFRNAINRLRLAGVTEGCNPPDNDEYCPDGFVTRGQMAAFLVRAFGFTDSGTGNYFTDTTDSVFKVAIDRLRVAGVTEGCNPPDNDEYCPDDRVTRGQMAAFLKRGFGE